MTGAWSPANQNVNDIIGSSSANVRARVRQLVRDFPYFANAANRIVDYTVGAGITFQSKIKTADGTLDKKRIQKAEDAFAWWADEADVAKKLHFYELMQLDKRQEVESGEFFLIKRYRPNENRFIPFCLQAYEADWLTTQHDRGYGQTGIYKPNEPKADIYQGIEYDRMTGQVIAYHFTDPDSWGKPIRIEGKDVIHGFQTLRPGQLRGISPFSPGVLLAHDLQDYMDAEIDAAKMAAKYLAFVKSDSPTGKQLNLTTEQNSNNETEYIDELENAIIEYLNPGESVEIATNPRPGSNFPPFVRLILCMMSITTGIPYEILSGDYQGLNYSTARTARNDFAFYLRPIIIRHIRHFCTPTINSFFDYSVVAGKLDFPNYFANPYPLRSCEWQPPGMASIDPLRETKAHIEAINNNLESPQENIRARGRDPEEVIKEIKQWQEWEEENDLAPAQNTSTALANNPKAVEGQKNLGNVVRIKNA